MAMTDADRPPTTDLVFVRTGDADAATVAQFRHDLASWLTQALGVDDVKHSDVLLAVSEALSNAAEYAYEGAAARGPMTVEVTYRHDVDRLDVMVSDGGRWHDQSGAPRSTTRGRGLPLIHLLADHTVVDRQAMGTTVLLRFDKLLGGG
jgi:serine/threonine-protein kinase RsbW